MTREMKDSGIEWIGEVPKDWSITKLKYIIQSPLQYGANESGIDYRDELPRYIRITDITMDNKLKEEGKLSLEEETAKPYLLYDCDILFARSGASVGKTFMYKIQYGKAAFAGYLIRATINSDKAIPSFVYYNTLGHNYEAWKQRIFIQSTIQNIGADKFCNYVFAYPSLPKQQAIVKSLDVKCTEIDKILSKTRASIEEYRKLKQAVITQAVIKGIRGNCPMKDSDIKWVGHIPSNWNTYPIYYSFGERKNKNSLGQEKNLLSLSYGKIIRKDINSKEGLLPDNFNTYNIVEVGDIIIRPTDLQNDKRSLRTGIVKEHGIITSAYIALKPIRSINATYYHYQLHAFDVMKVFYNMGNGIRQGLNFREFSHLRVIEPPREEQDSIVEYLDEKCKEIDNLISKKEEYLVEIENYKKSLIYEYVTGKKRV